MSDTGMNVKVAVRVRPFSNREIVQNTSCCIKMIGNQTIITDPETGKENKFTYDYSYWSHNQDQDFASQETVFNDLGITVLNNAWQGYNTSIFAYGQTGSGKSHTMVGHSKDDKGLIPRVCEEMFNRIAKDERALYRVEASMIEIYNEQVRDLFNPTNPLNKHGLKVRENPQTGPYVEGLESAVVKSHREISELMEEGNRMRTIAKTNMNDTSSRAHTIFQIQLTCTTTTQMDDGDTVFSEKSSRINLIDLAGSERVSKTGATGDRLKEGASINVSLTTLGNVINKLAELSDAPKKGKNVFVPYRDSVLTWLLKDSLGGNSKTIMIAAISPSDFNYGETLSTLRYANRAKNIKNRAIVNEDANVAIIRELKEEVERLKVLLAQHENGEKMIQSEQERARLVDELEASKRIIDSLQMTPMQKQERSLEIKRMRQRALQEAGLMATPGAALTEEQNRAPHLFNLNEDPLLTGMLVYYLQDGNTSFGREKSNENSIVLASSTIQPQHCYIEVTDFAGVKMSKLYPIANATVYVNGVLVGDCIELAHGDRIIFGNNHVFRFVDPSTDMGDNMFDSFDWSFAQKELTDVQGIQAILSEKEREWEENWKQTKLKQLEEEFEAERQKMLSNGFGLLPMVEQSNEMPVENKRMSASVMTSPMVFDYQELRMNTPMKSPGAVYGTMSPAVIESLKAAMTPKSPAVIREFDDEESVEQQEGVEGEQQQEEGVEQKEAVEGETVVDAQEQVEQEAVEQSEQKEQQEGEPVVVEGAAVVVVAQDGESTIVAETPVSPIELLKELMKTPAHKTPAMMVMEAVMTPKSPAMMSSSPSTMEQPATVASPSNEESVVKSEEAVRSPTAENLVKTPSDRKVLTFEDTQGMIIYDNGTGTGSDEMQFSPSRETMEGIIPGTTGSNGSGQLTRSRSFRDRFVDTLRRMQGKAPLTEEYKKSKKLDKHLLRTLPLLKEANMLAREVRLNVSYDLKIVIRNETPLLYVQLFDKTTQRAHLLTTTEFENALFTLRERSKKPVEKPNPTAILLQAMDSRNMESERVVA